MLKICRQRLNSVEGHLRIWVHPLYTEQYPNSALYHLDGFDLGNVQEKLRSAFFRTIDSVAKNHKSSPVVIYEEKGKINETKQLISTHLNCETSALEKIGIIFIL